MHFPLFPEEIGTRILDGCWPVCEKRRSDPLDGRAWREDHVRSVLLKRYPALELPDASKALRGLRECKGPEEVAAMREAARISSEGMKEAMRAARPGAFEYEMEGAMFGECKRLGGQDWAYAPIVGSGPNALVMHYNRNSRKAQEGDIVLMDAAFSWHYYASDITRSFPVGGRFSAEQRKVYEDLLKVQKETILRVRPGVSLLDLHEWTQRQLRTLGYGPYLVHFLGHGIGMAVHDPWEATAPLRAGNVITIEPGVYLFDRGFGMRIEDDVLVTATGSEVLSAGVTKEADEIEALILASQK
jgi:Xaa-Pro aminopeptidase